MVATPADVARASRYSPLCEMGRVPHVDNVVTAPADAALTNGKQAYTFRVIPAPQVRRGRKFPGYLAVVVDALREKWA
jgi:hypothetical protein